MFISFLCVNMKQRSSMQQSSMQQSSMQLAMRTYVASPFDSLISFNINDLYLNTIMLFQ